MVLRLIKVIASFTFFGFMSLSTTAWASAPNYQQLPSHDGGFGSDPVFIVADDFQLTQEASLQSITWWGGYLTSYRLPIPDADNFLISLYADDSGKPGSLLQSFNVGNDASRTSTGDFVLPPDFSDPFFFYPGMVEFQYSFNLSSAVSLHADTHYWLSIVNSPSYDSWVWENSINFPNPGVQRSFMGGAWEPFDTENTAFSLGLTSPVPEPETYAMLLVGLGLLGFMVHRKKQNA